MGILIPFGLIVNRIVNQPQPRLQRLRGGAAKDEALRQAVEARASQAETLDLPLASQAFFYLVTASNLLGEEGTKGYDSIGAERPNPAPCP